MLPFTPVEAVLNLSATRLTDVELEILKNGLKHSIEPLYINKTDVLITFDFIHRSMSKYLKHEKQLRNNKDILITKPGKDDWVIIVNRTIYMSNLYEIINDTSKLPSSPTIGREGKLQRFVRTLNKKGFFSKEQY